MRRIALFAVLLLNAMSLLGQTIPPPPGNLSSTDRFEYKYEKQFPLGKRWPEDLSNALILVPLPTISRDKRYRKLSEQFRKMREIEPEEVKKILSQYIVVSKEEWENGYSRTLAGARSGYIILPNKTRIQWMIRLGGLAQATYSDGGTVFLAKCRSGWFENK